MCPEAACYPQRGPGVAVAPKTHFEVAVRHVPALVQLRHQLRQCVPQPGVRTQGCRDSQLT